MRLGSIVHHRWFAWGFILFCLVMSVSLIRNSWRLSHQVDHSQQEAEDLQKLQETAEQLKQDIQREQTPFEQEKVIRNQLNMQKEGEIIIQLPPLPTPTPQPTLIPTPTPQIYQQWWNEFGW